MQTSAGLAALWHQDGVPALSLNQLVFAAKVANRCVGAGCIGEVDETFARERVKGWSKSITSRV